MRDWSASTPEERPVRLALFPSLVGLAICSVVLTACGSGSSSGGTTTSTHAGDDTATTTAADAAIISAWLAAQEAFHQAALTSNPDDPGLAATMVDPQLSGVRAALARLKVAGDVGRGPMEYGSPMIVRQGSNSAVVQSCIHDQEIEVQAATGHPVNGVLGESDFELVTATMTLTPSGWKVASQSEDVGRCSGP